MRHEISFNWLCIKPGYRNGIQAQNTQVLLDDQLFTPPRKEAKEKELRKALVRIT